MTDLIKQVNSPADLKALDYRKLNEYCGDLRDFILDTVRNTGGHLASSLGAVELTVALHYVFDCPKDKILWDVGHQAYAHKIITGRRDKFSQIRTDGGISGFPRMSESECDAFTMGHSSTSLSVGLGYSRARDGRNENYEVISVIGDGAFGGGMVYEALNDIGASHTKMIIVLNDNKMSISRNVGAMSEYLSKLRLSKRYSRLKYTVKKGLLGIPLVGTHIYRALDKTKEGIKALTQSNKMFEQMGIKYYGPIDGHNLSNLIGIFKRAKGESGPVLIHILTDKGKGDPEVESHPSQFHGIQPSGARATLDYSTVLSEFLCEDCANKNEVVAITAAMSDGTGLTAFGEKFPERCFDVGIAEQHAVTLAAGLAAGGLKPYFAVYSTFLQRGFDQMIHDVCLNNLGVTFLIDRAGAVGADGVTHQGIYDLSYLGMIPGITVLAPKDGNEFHEMLKFSLSFDRPLAIRYPKSYVENRECVPIQYGKWERLKSSDSKVFVLAVGGRAIDAAWNVSGINLINARFVKPLDIAFLDSINKSENKILTIEDGSLKGGFGQSVISYLNTVGLKAKVKSMGYPDEFLESYSVSDSLESIGISELGIAEVIKNFQ